MANMFKPVKAKNIPDYLASIAQPRRAEMQELHALIQKTIPKLKPFFMYNMIGYGKFHYKYPSGREGDWARIALASQKNYISVYVCAIKNGKYLAEARKKELPKASVGKSCIRFKRPSDIDLKVLLSIIKEGSTGTFGI